MECPVCKKEFDEKTGRRPKKFCSDTCKVRFWNAFKKVRDNGTPENKKKEVKVVNLTSTPPKTNYAINTDKLTEYEAELAKLKEGMYANQRRKFLQEKIAKLKMDIPRSGGIIE